MNEGRIRYKLVQGNCWINTFADDKLYFIRRLQYGTSFKNDKLKVEIRLGD